MGVGGLELAKTKQNKRKMASFVYLLNALALKHDLCATLLGDCHIKEHALKVYFELSNDNII